MPHPPTRSYQMRVGLVLLGLLILASGCMAPSLPAIPEATEDHSAHMADGDAAATPLDDTSMMATHEAQMADPAAQATQEALMADPAAMATHEAEMHGTPTPSPAEPVAAAGAPLSTFNTADFAGSGLCVLCHEGLFDAEGNDVSITTHWRSTMMANAARPGLAGQGCVRGSAQPAAGRDRGEVRRLPRSDGRDPDRDRRGRGEPLRERPVSAREPAPRGGAGWRFVHSVPPDPARQPG